MYSVLGLSGDQNNTTFDGLGSGVTALPPDILATTSIRPYPFDPSIGGFSGAQITIQTIPGTNFSRRLITTTAITPPLEWAQSDRGRAGAEVHERAHRRQRRRARSSWIARSTTSPTTSAVSSATFRRCSTRARSACARPASRRIPWRGSFSILRSNRIPIDRADSDGDAGARRRAIRRQRRSDAERVGGGEFVHDRRGGELSAHAAGQSRRPAARRRRRTPATCRRGARTRTIAHSNYFGFGVLSKTTLGFAARRRTRGRTNRCPRAACASLGVRRRKLVGEDADVRRQLAAIVVGDARDSSHESDQLVHARRQSHDQAGDERHRATHSRDETSTSELGTFRYNSLADLDAGVARRASRARSTPTPRHGRSQLTGAASLGDAWRPTEGLQVQYGVRADANRFLVAAGAQSGNSRDVRRRQLGDAESRVSSVRASACSGIYGARRRSRMRPARRVRRGR